MSVVFWKTVLAILMVWLAIIAIVITEDACSRHKSIGVKLFALRIGVSLAGLAIVIVMFIYIGG